MNNVFIFILFDSLIEDVKYAKEEYILHNID